MTEIKKELPKEDEQLLVCGRFRQRLEKINDYDFGLIYDTHKTYGILENLRMMADVNHKDLDTELQDVLEDEHTRRIVKPILGKLVAVKQKLDVEQAIFDRFEVRLSEMSDHEFNDLYNEVVSGDPNSIDELRTVAGMGPQHTDEDIDDILKEQLDKEFAKRHCNVPMSN